jgi:hypothetical protein
MLGLGVWVEDKLGGGCCSGVCIWVGPGVFWGETPGENTVLETIFFGIYSIEAIYSFLFS